MKLQKVLKVVKDHIKFEQLMNALCKKYNVFATQTHVVVNNGNTIYVAVMFYETK